MASRSFFLVVASAAILCAVTAFPFPGEDEPKFNCDDACKQKMEKLKVMVEECMEQTGCQKEDLEQCQGCNDDVPEKAQKFNACVAKKVGVLDENGMVSMAGWEKIGEKFDESCEKVTDDEDIRKKMCENKDTIKSAVRECIEEGQKAQIEGDDGVAATMAIRKCMCKYKQEKKE